MHVQAKPISPLPISLPILGKVNHGRILYGRGTRHIDVRRCAVGSAAFYYGLRFDISKEFEHLDDDYFLENSNWFEIKILTNPYRTGDRSNKEPLSDDAYTKSMKFVLTSLALPTNKTKHFGRIVGHRMMELNEIHREEIRQLGNWNPNVEDESYSSKLPMKAIRGAAGFVEADGIYYNPRTNVLVTSKELLAATPFGCFEPHYARVLEVSKQAKNKAESKQTALQFLSFMRELNQVFLQDAAAMMIEHPERSDHPVFQLPCFKMEQFAVSSRIDLLLLDARLPT